MAAAIRIAAAGDAAALAEIGERTFRETFLEDHAIPYPPADLAAWLPQVYSEAAMARRLADPAWRLWLAEDAGEAVGYASAGPCRLPHEDASAADGQLHQLYVARAAQGTGLGARLFDIAVGWLEARDGPRVWLGVWSGNAKAQGFYHRRGFANVGGYQFPVGEWRDDEFIFRKG